jgi:hypothetical protein
MSAGLDASTVTPGKTAPLESLADPAMLPCARTATGNSNKVNATNKTRGTSLIVPPPNPV